MIEEHRPLKTVVYQRPNVLSSRYLVNDAFDGHTCDTLDVDGFFDSEENGPRIVEACEATWFEKDGTLDFMGYEHSVEVRCLEPALYYVQIGGWFNHAGGAGSFCEFHKPRVVSL